MTQIFSYLREFMTFLQTFKTKTPQPIFRPPWSWKTDPPVDQSKFFQPITHVKKLQRLHVMLSLHFPALLNNQRKRDTCETLDT